MIAAAMSNLNVAASQTVATSRHGHHNTGNTRDTHTGSRGTMSVEQGPAINSIGANAFRLNTTIGTMWSMTGVGIT